MKTLTNTAKLIIGIVLIVMSITTSSCVSQKTEVATSSPFNPAIESSSGIKTVKINGQVIILISSDKIFVANSSEFTSEASPLLQKTVTIISKYPDKNIHVSANTDTVSSNLTNALSKSNLSVKQASHVAIALRKFGISNKDHRRLTFSGDQDKYPIATNKNLLGETVNRRIEIILYDKGKSYSVSGKKEKHFSFEDYIF